MGESNRRVWIELVTSYETVTSSVFLVKFSTSLLAASSKFSTNSGTSSSAAAALLLATTSLANRFKCFKPSGPNCVRMLGSISVI